MTCLDWPGPDPSQLALQPESEESYPTTSLRVGGPWAYVPLRPGSKSRAGGGRKRNAIPLRIPPVSTQGCFASRLILSSRSGSVFGTLARMVLMSTSLPRAARSFRYRSASNADNFSAKALLTSWFTDTHSVCARRFACCWMEFGRRYHTHPQRFCFEKIV